MRFATAEGWRTALFQSVITHYDTFIHTGCKVPWALRGLSRGGMRSLRRPLLTKAKMSAPFPMVSPVCMKLFCVNFLLQPMSTDTFSKACGHRNSPNERMCAVSITSVSRSFAAYIRTSNGIYSTCRHSSGMSSGTYVHGESP